MHQFCGVHFIPPCLPTLQLRPPTGPLWSHEFKFDGYRVQIHKRGEEVVVYARRGANFTRRAGRPVVEAVRGLRCFSCVLDAELIAFDDAEVPNFAALHQGTGSGLGVVAFDILEHDEVDLRPELLAERRRWLTTLFPASGSLALSETFDDPQVLLAAAEQNGLEGIVSKRIDRPYRSGPSRDWVKIKTKTSRDENRERGKLFEARDKRLPRRGGRRGSLTSSDVDGAMD